MALFDWRGPESGGRSHRRHRETRDRFSWVTVVIVGVGAVIGAAYLNPNGAMSYGFHGAVKGVALGQKLGVLDTSSHLAHETFSADARAYHWVLVRLMSSFFTEDTTLQFFRDAPAMDFHHSDPSVSVTEVTFPSRADQVPVSAQLLLPSGQEVAAAKGAWIHLHGGGHSIGSYKTETNLCAALAALSGLPVLNVDMRLLPEAEADQQVGDCVGAVDYLVSLGLSDNQIFVTGGSAGANLAIVTGLELLAEGRTLAGIAPSSPSELSQLFNREDYPSTVRNDEFDFLSDTSLKFFTDQLNEKAIKRFSVLDRDYAGFPPTRVIVGGGEKFQDHGIRLAQILAEHDVDVQLDDAPGLWHVPQTGFCFVPEAYGVLERLANWSGEVLSKRK